jgi:hypothetical protein
MTNKPKLPFTTLVILAGRSATCGAAATGVDVRRRRRCERFAPIRPAMGRRIPRYRAPTTTKFATSPARRPISLAVGRFRDRGARPSSLGRHVDSPRHGARLGGRGRDPDELLGIPCARRVRARSRRVRRGGRMSERGGVRGRDRNARTPGHGGGGERSRDHADRHHRRRKGRVPRESGHGRLGRRGARGERADMSPGGRRCRPEISERLQGGSSSVPAPSGSTATSR